MNIFDIVLVLFCSFFLWRGLQIGFIKSALFYVSILCALTGSLYFEPFMNDKWLQWDIQIPTQWISVISYVSLFFVIVICVQGISWGIRLILKPLLAGPVDHVLGFFFGFIKSFFFCILICWLLSKSSDSFRKIILLESSVIYKYAKITFPFVEKTYEEYNNTPFELLRKENLFGFSTEKKSKLKPKSKKSKLKVKEDLNADYFLETGSSTWHY